MWGDPVRFLGSLMRGLARMAGTPEAVAEVGGWWSMMEGGALLLRNPARKYVSL